MNYIIKSTILLFFYMLLLFSCGGQKKQNLDYCIDTSIDSILVRYYNHDPTFVRPQTCERLIGDEKRIIPPTFKESYNPQTNSYFVNWCGILDTIIVDCIVLKEIEKEVNSLISIPDTLFVDARMVCIIYYKDGSQNQICINNFGMASQIYYNGLSCKKNPRLLYLIRKNSGYYSWFDKNQLKDHYELYDTTFIRDSITMTYENNPRVRVQ